MKDNQKSIVCQTNDLLSSALCNSYISMEHSKAIESILSAILKLTSDDVIRGLAEHGKYLAGSMANDMDVLRNDIEISNSIGRMN